MGRNPRGVTRQIFTLRFIKLKIKIKGMKQQQKNFMVGSHHTRETVLKSHSIKKVENHRLRLGALPILAEHQTLFPSTHMAAHSHL